MVGWSEEAQFGSKPMGTKKLMSQKGGEYLLGHEPPKVKSNRWLHKRTCLFPAIPDRKPGLAH